MGVEAMTVELLADARTELDGAASLLTDVLGVGSARMHPHDNKFTLATATTESTTG